MKKYLRKEILVSVFFLAVIFFFGFMTAYRNYPFAPSEIEKVYTDDFYKKESFVEIWSHAQNAMSIQKAIKLEDSEYGYIIRDTHEKLHFPAQHMDVSDEAQSTVAFSEFLSGRNIPFVYVQTPNKKLDDYTVFPFGAENHANEDCDVFLGELEKNGVNTFDLRDEIVTQNLSRNELFYATDHHWTTKTAFWAFDEVVRYLNESFDLEIDTDGFYRDLDNYTVTHYPDSFLGSQGRRVGSSVSGYDDYDFISPDFKTDYSIYDGFVSLDEPAYSGDFSESIVIQSILDSKDKSANKHAAYFEYDYGNLIIKNNAVDNDLKILLIKDSFSLPFAAFLSTCVNELHMADLRDDGWRAEDAVTVAQYAENGDFDCVVVMYNPEVFDTVMFDFGG